MASGYQWGARSLQRLGTCAPRLRVLMTAALQADDCPCDCTVIGPRVTNARPGQSRHNSMPSQAVDAGPCDRSGAVLWDDKAKFDAWGAHVKATAARLNIGIRWGGDFSFYDGAHFELEDQS